MESSEDIFKGLHAGYLLEDAYSTVWACRQNMKEQQILLLGRADNGKTYD